MKRIILIATAIAACTTILTSRHAMAMSDFDQASNNLNQPPSYFDRFENCEKAKSQARDLIMVVQRGLENYRQLETLSPKQYPVDQILRAKYQALDLIRAYRDKTQEQENDVLSSCNVDMAENTLHGLETAFDRLNIELAMHAIRRRSRSQVVTHL